MLKDITVSFAPHISRHISTRRIMIDVIIALSPAIIAAFYFFRKYALILIPVCVISSVITEWLCNLARKKANPLESLGDFSAVITGIILALSLPPAIPYWAAIIGSCFSIAVGKMVFGGLGANIFNPAMIGRAFLTASFGMLMTTWTVPATLNSQMPQITVAKEVVDARTQATPLAWSKQAIKADKAKQPIKAGDINEQLKDTIIGTVGGCLGETSAIAILIGGIYLLIRKTITWHIPVAVLLSAFIFSAVAYLINSSAYISPLMHITTGGLLLGAFFIATDPVTAPLTPLGRIIFGVGIGAITILIRVVGEYPEGVMFAVLLMNSITPMIDKFCKPVPVGGKPNA